MKIARCNPRAIQAVGRCDLPYGFREHLPRLLLKPPGQYPFPETTNHEACTQAAGILRRHKYPHLNLEYQFLIEMYRSHPRRGDPSPSRRNSDGLEPVDIVAQAEYPTRDQNHGEEVFLLKLSLKLDLSSQ